jgi:dolichol-phosphate mannosyltransferase
LYKGITLTAVVPVFNEEGKIDTVLRRIPRTIVDEIIAVDDGSTDRSPEIARHFGATVIPLGVTLGVGAALRTAYAYALDKGYDVVVTMAGNNKDAPEEIPALLDPIVEEGADFVQGSRFLKKSDDFGDMPLYRRIATRLHPLLFSVAARRWVTESTNGFRAMRTRVLADPRLDLSPSWLDQYELEPYLYLRVIRLGYKTVEVPVTKVYPPRRLGQTKMRPISGWWSILRPLVYVGLGLRK